MKIKNKLPNIIETERLVLEKEEIDSTMTIYNLCRTIDERKIGAIGILDNREIMYRVDYEFQNKGYMTEAMKGLLENIKKRAYFLVIDKDNEASQKIAKKIGFIKREEKDKYI